MLSRTASTATTSYGAGMVDDFLHGHGGNDTLHGKKGNDFLDGGDGNDTIDGGDGDDILNGGEGDDRMDGGEGNDILNGGSGINFLKGGTGGDTFVICNDGVAIVIDFEPGIDKIEGLPEKDSDIILLYDAENNATIVCVKYETATIKDNEQKKVDISYKQVMIIQNHKAENVAKLRNNMQKQKTATEPSNAADATPDSSCRQHDDRNSPEVGYKNNDLFHAVTFSIMPDHDYDALIFS